MSFPFLSLFQSLVHLTLFALDFARIITRIKESMVEVQTLVEGGLKAMVETTLEIMQEGETRERRMIRGVEIRGSTT